MPFQEVLNSQKQRRSKWRLGWTHTAELWRERLSTLCNIGEPSVNCSRL